MKREAIIVVAKQNSRLKQGDVAPLSTKTPWTQVYSCAVSLVMAGMELELQPWIYRCVWLGVVGLHCVCAVFLTQLARVYLVIAHPYLENIATTVMGEYYPDIRHAIVVIALVSALHWWQLCGILWASLRAKELVFADSNSSIASRVLDTFKTSVQSRRGDSVRAKLTGVSARRRGRSLSVVTSAVATSSKTLDQWTQRLARVWRLLFGRFGVFGIESRMFRAVFTARELAEIVSQTFQAQRSSELLPRPWLNHLLIALVVANCWSTPVVQQFLGHHQGLERVVCLFVDTMLSMGSSMVIPVAIFLPYYRLLSPTTLLFPVGLMFDSIWYTRLVMEARLLFSLSPSDVLSKLVQHLGIYFSLTTAVVLIRRRKKRESVSPKQPEPTTSTNIASTIGSNDPNARSVSNDADGATTTSITLVLTSRRRHAVVHICFVVWGLAVLAIHIKTTMKYQQELQGCSLTTASWFASGHPCSVYEYNCHRHGMTSPDEESWRYLEPDTLMFFAITHCSELKIPRYVQNFRNLQLLHLHNTTLVDWSKESAISAMQHTKLAVLAISRTNLTGIPDGLLEPLPDKLQNVMITHSNLTGLPANLHTKWHALVVLHLEHSLVREFPKTLLSLPTRELSLHGNLLETIPELSNIRHHHFLSFVLSANPLAALPDTLGGGTSFTFFSAERTLLKTLPAWMHTSVSDAKFLFGTPYCNFQQTQEEACIARDERGNGKSPIEAFDAKFPW